MLSHATSYRKLHSFISMHFETLKVLCDLSWKRAPAYTTLCNIIKGLSPEEAEKAVRQATKEMSHASPDQACLTVGRCAFSRVMGKRDVTVLSTSKISKSPNC